MRGRAADHFRSLRFTAFHYRHYHRVMALVWLLSVMNGFEREQNNILGFDASNASSPAEHGSLNPEDSHRKKR